MGLGIFCICGSFGSFVGGPNKKRCYETQDLCLLTSGSHGRGRKNLTRHVNHTHTIHARPIYRSPRSSILCRVVPPNSPPPRRIPLQFLSLGVKLVWICNVKFFEDNKASRRNLPTCLVDEGCVRHQGTVVLVVLRFVPGWRCVKKTGTYVQPDSFLMCCFSFLWLRD